MTHKVIYGDHDDRTLAQLDRCLSTGSAAAGVLCADGHLGYAHPIGGVVGYTDHISISGVGFDIACGNMAVRLDTRYDDIKDQVGTILQDVAKVVSFGIGRKNAEKVDHDLFDSDLWMASHMHGIKDMARNQLGTVGSGNHYVDLFEDEDGFVWIGVHFGSRGLGHKTTTRYLHFADAKDGMEVAPALLDANSDLGRGYIAGVELGGLYAYAGREWVVEKVRSIIGGAVTLPGSVRLCGRIDGRQCCDPAWGGKRSVQSCALLHSAWRGPRDVAHGSNGPHINGGAVHRTGLQFPDSLHGV
jgi:tRNA-splicing ligase RtcB (3'-phosphate/5'-hydroxy nucleic acid ligase)